MRRSMILLGLLLLLLLTVSALATDNAVQAAAPSPIALLDATPTELPLPIDVNVIGTYIHSSGLFSIPIVAGWQLAPGGDYETIPDNLGIYVGADFINNMGSSVFTVAADSFTSLSLKTVADLNSYFNKRYFDNVWVNFPGGYTEINRQLGSNRLVINFKLKGHTDYVARLISRADHGWAVALRLVAPANNPTLLDRLEKAVWPTLIFYPNEAAVPLTWATYHNSNSSYLLKYPADWNKSSDAATSFAAVGALGGLTVVLKADVASGQSVKTEAAARNWLIKQKANAQILTIVPETQGTLSGFGIAYTFMSNNNQPQSGIVTIRNSADGTLYWLSLDVATSNVNLLKPGTDPDRTLLTNLRNTFMVLPTGAFMPTPVPTEPPSPTITGGLLDPASLDMNTAQTYHSPNNVLDIDLPSGWTPLAKFNKQNSFSFYLSTPSKSSTDLRLPIILVFRIATLQNLYADSLITPTSASPSEFLAAYAAKQKGNAATYLSDVYPSTIGALSGSEVSVSPSAIFQHSSLISYDMRIAALSNGQVLFLIVDGPEDLYEQTRHVLDSIIDSIVIHSERIMPNTPTPTPIPLELSVTAIQQLIQKLTATTTTSRTRPTATIGATSATVSSNSLAHAAD